jgi:hypothetical protein
MPFIYIYTIYMPQLHMMQGGHCRSPNPEQFHIERQTQRKEKKKQRRRGDRSRSRHTRALTVFVFLPIFVSQEKLLKAKRERAASLARATSINQPKSCVPLGAAGGGTPAAGGGHVHGSNAAGAVGGEGWCPVTAALGECERGGRADGGAGGSAGGGGGGGGGEGHTGDMAAGGGGGRKGERSRSANAIDLLSRATRRGVCVFACVCVCVRRGRWCRGGSCAGCMYVCANVYIHIYIYIGSEHGKGDLPSKMEPGLKKDVLRAGQGGILSHTHTHTHTNIHKHTPSRYPYKYLHIHMYTYTFLHTHIYTYIQGSLPP